MWTLLTKKPTLGALLLAGAAGGPYVLYETDAGQSARVTATSFFGGSATGAGQSTWGGQHSTNSTTISPIVSSGTTQDLWNFNLGTPSIEDLQDHAGKNLTGPQIVDLREVLRFDISPAWVPQRFSRVSTILSELDLDGLRVPLVTGTAVGDLAGTLTYYFDRYQQLQRVNVQALTGDPMRVVQTLQQYYQLQQEPALGGGLYTIKWNGRASSVLYVAPAPIIYANAEHSRYSVFLELNQPNIPYGLSNEARQLLEAGRNINRW